MLRWTSPDTPGHFDWLLASADLRQVYERVADCRP
jgi:hypothetical protein